ncbi:hypothetical protein LOZ53_000274 [Ophidiomyces ophidiicola]|nr:hypothetical protein LOZ53_000274 [Ophidiomyces ophidiicola]
MEYISLKSKLQFAPLTRDFEDPTGLVNAKIKMLSSNQVQKKPFTCFYWKTTKCRFTAQDCRYLHEHTGHVASSPYKPKSKPKSKSIELPLKQPEVGTSESDDLISLSSSFSTPMQKRQKRNHEISGLIEGDDSALSPSPDVRVLVESIILAIRQHQDYGSLKNMLATIPRQELKEIFACNQLSFSALLAAVHTNRPNVIKLLVEHGANPDATSEAGVPLLMPIILNSGIYATAIVRAILALGANPHVIPPDLWAGGNTQVQEGKGRGSQTTWCSERQRTVLRDSLTVSMQYYFSEASLCDGTAAINTLVTREISTSVVGQRYALTRITEYLIGHHVLQGNSPLVVAFVGAPGYGKRTLARSLGEFREISQFSGHDNMLSSMDNIDEPKVSASVKHGLDIVFIDCDKVDHSWLKSLLNTVDNDTYQYKAGKKMSRRKTAYILSVPQTVDSAPWTSTDNPNPNNYETPRDPKLFELLRNKIEPSLRDYLSILYGPSITSRIELVVPFIPFTKDEVAVLAHRFTIEAVQELEKDCMLRDSYGKKRAGGFDLRADPDIYYSFFDLLYYDYKGARDIQKEVAKHIALPMAQKYLSKFAEHVSDFEGVIKVRSTDRICNGSEGIFLDVEVL